MNNFCHITPFTCSEHSFFNFNSSKSPAVASLMSMGKAKRTTGQYPASNHQGGDGYGTGIYSEVHEAGPASYNSDSPLLHRHAGNAVPLKHDAAPREWQDKAYMAQQSLKHSQSDSAIKAAAGEATLHGGHRSGFTGTNEYQHRSPSKAAAMNSKARAFSGAVQEAHRSDPSASGLRLYVEHSSK